MKVKDVRLHFSAWRGLAAIQVYDQNDRPIFEIPSGKRTGRTKAQAFNFAKRLCYRFNAGQEGK